ncbi:hypothetical protein niasHT_018640 [Heterodera trifolii]|uniref:Ras-associating domain-containing protein n=1 Tax=Heterodera trifolii TaxID=157864 RepID=A0ABD2KZ29_9BILA
MAAAAHQRQKLCETIERWNATMMDMFAISLPDENTEFNGVIRFHLHEQQRQQSSPASTTTGAAATKCMRVSSMYTVAQVVDALVAKSHAEADDMHMAATTPASASYSLWEVHDDDGTGGVSERQMDADERPLLVQLGWCCHNNGITSGDKKRSDGNERCVAPSTPMRNGRFVLRRRLPPPDNDTAAAAAAASAEFTRSVPRRFSKRRQAVTATPTTAQPLGGSVKSVGGGKKRAQLLQNKAISPQKQKHHLYDSVPSAALLPPVSPLCGTLAPFARTLSNPELVLKRRREQKLDDRLRHMSSGGSLKIYGVELFPHRPYVTLLVNATDTAEQVVRATLDKYGLEEADTANFGLAEVFLRESDAMSRSFSDLRSIEKQRERLLNAAERPLQLLEQHMANTTANTNNNVVFFLRCRPPATFQRPQLMPPLPPPHHHHHQRHNSRTAAENDVNDIRDEEIKHVDRVASTGAASSLVTEAVEFCEAEPGGKAMAPAPQPSSAAKSSSPTALFSCTASSSFHPSLQQLLLLPCLVPINAFASTANFGAGAVAIQPGITEIGSSSSCAIQLRAPSVLPRHCALRYIPPAAPRKRQNSSPAEEEDEAVQQEAVDGQQQLGLVSISLLDKSALVELDGASIHAECALQNGVQLRIGGVYCYRFFNSQHVQQQQQKDYFPSPPSPLPPGEEPFVNNCNSPTTTAVETAAAAASTAAAVVVHFVEPQQQQDQQQQLLQSEAALIVQNIFSPSSTSTPSVPSLPRQQHQQQRQQQQLNCLNLESAPPNEYVELGNWLTPSYYSVSSNYSTPTSAFGSTPAAPATDHQQDEEEEEEERHQMVTLITAASSASAHFTQQPPAKRQQHQRTTPTMTHIATAGANDRSHNNQYNNNNRRNSGRITSTTNHHQLEASPSSAMLPLLIECVEPQCEHSLFHSVFFATTTAAAAANNDPNASSAFLSIVQQQFGTFRLTPTFVLYALCRQRLLNQHNDHAENGGGEQQQRAHHLIGNTFAMFIDCCSRMKKQQQSSRELLAFWLSNAAELLNMGRADAHLARAVGTALLHELSRTVQHLFTLLVDRCKQQLLAHGIQPLVHHLLSAQQTNGTSSAVPSSSPPALVAVLDECLRVVRWALLNPALTIQLFSQLFHFISATLFNWLVNDQQQKQDTRPRLCLQLGLQLKQLLLHHMQKWSEQQGLELAAECHMDRLCQTAHLLATPKYLDQIAVLGTTCYRLNSVQMRYLLEHYVGNVRTGEPPAVSRELIEHLVALSRQQHQAVSEAAAAEQHQQDGGGGGNEHHQQPQLFEGTSLQLPFLLPHDGYVVEKLRGIPPDMAAFVNALQQRGLVRRVFVQQQQHQRERHGSAAATEEMLSWNVHMMHHHQPPAAAATVQQQHYVHVAPNARRSVSTTPSIASVLSHSAFSAPPPATVAAVGTAAPAGANGGGGGASAAVGVTLFPPTPTPPPHQNSSHGGGGGGGVATTASSGGESSPVYAEIRRQHNSHGASGFQQQQQQQQQPQHNHSQKKKQSFAPQPPTRCQSASIFANGGGGGSGGTANNAIVATGHHHHSALNWSKKASSASSSPAGADPCHGRQQWNERQIDAEGARQLVVERIALSRPNNNGTGGGIGLSIVEVVSQFNYLAF